MEADLERRVKKSKVAGFLTGALVGAGITALGLAFAPKMSSHPVQDDKPLTYQVLFDHLRRGNDKTERKGLLENVLSRYRDN